MIRVADLPRGAAASEGPGPGGEGVEPGPPVDPALETWSLFLRAQALVRHLLEDRLARLRHVPLAELEVLLHLQAVPEGRMRMAVLADRVLLSRSGLTRRIERLERLGLVERQACPNDARGAFAVLTAAGQARSQEAAADHRAGIEEVFASPLAVSNGLQPLRVALATLIESAEAQLASRGAPCGSEAASGSGLAAACPGDLDEEARYTEGDV